MGLENTGVGRNQPTSRLDKPCFLSSLPRARLSLPAIRAACVALGHVGCVAKVSAVLHPFVFLDYRWVHQIHLKSGTHQTIHQPVPVVHRFNYHTNGFFSVWRKHCPCFIQVACRTLLINDASSASVTATTLLFDCRSIPIYFFVSVSLDKGRFAP